MFVDIAFTFFLGLAVKLSKTIDDSEKPSWVIQMEALSADVEPMSHFNLAEPYLHPWKNLISIPVETV